VGGLPFFLALGDFMKLFNKMMAGKKLKSPWGVFEVDKDGCVSITDKDAQQSLLNSGFTMEDGEIVEPKQERHEYKNHEKYVKQEKHEHKPKWQRSKS
jgi:hypothetical protein